MPKFFEKGNPGKPKGAKNKVSRELKEKLKEFADADFELFLEDFKKLPANERMKTRHVIWEFFIAKMKSVEVSGDLVSTLSEGQSKEICRDIAKEAIFKTFGDQISPELRKKYE